MGCVYSLPKHRSANNSSSNGENPRVFHVCNVDDRGTEINFGKIEISDNDLVLHQKAKNSIYWPLRSLRRYGFDAELFSFECGRRCPTGPGIYAFRCSEAEQLFNTLQEAIQQCSTTQYPIFLGGPLIGSELNNHSSNPTQTPPDPGPRYPMRPLAAPHLYSNDIHEYINSPFYVNTPAVIGQNSINGGNLITGQTHSNNGLNNGRSDVNTNYAKLEDLAKFYVNIKTPMILSQNQGQQSQPATHGRDSMGGGSLHGMGTASNCSQSPPHSPASTSNDPVNYIMLDLEPQVAGSTIVTTAPATPISKTPTMDYPPVWSNGTPPATPTALSPQQYAAIDFDKTKALSNSAANHRKL